jgi:hypothetical protein
VSLESARHGLPHLARLDPMSGRLIRASKTTAVRYERDQPGELLHMDVKKLGRIPDGGGQFLGRRRFYSRELASSGGCPFRWLLFGFPQDLTYRPVLGLRLDELI